LNGPLSGPGPLNKTGGGTLALVTASEGFDAALNVLNGSVRLRGSVGSPLLASSASTLDLAGASGPLGGTGSLVLPATLLRVPSIAGLRRSFLLTRPGSPDPSDAAASGNAVLVTQTVGQAIALEIYIDANPSPRDRFRGIYHLPAGADWSALLADNSCRIFLPDALGDQVAFGRTWSETALASLARVPARLNAPEGPIAGYILEVRFDGAPLTYAAWQSRHFAPSVDPAISGPAADPTGSGLANLFRFAFGLDATEAVSERLPIIRAENARAIFRFPYDPGLRHLRWLVESTTDLASWNLAEVLFDSASSLAEPDADGWLEFEHLASDARRFYRLRLVDQADQ
jgi:hypothetical protein